MNTQFKMMIYLTVLIVCILMKPSLAEVIPIENLEKTVFNQADQLDSLRQLHLRIINQSDIIIQEIKTYRIKSQLGRKEHSAQEKALLKSRELEQQIQEIKPKIDSLFTGYQDNLSILINRYQDSLEILISQIEQENNEDLKTALLIQFRELDTMKRYWELKRSPFRLKRYRELRITQHPQDSKQNLQFKANLLLDREEALRNNIVSIDQQIRSFKREQSIRSKAETFSMEMALFDENEERLGRHTEVGSDENRTFNFEDAWTNGSGQAAPAYYSGSEAILDEQPGSDIHGEPFNQKTPETADEIAESILRLENYRSQLSKTADSLHQKAEWFLSESANSP